MPDLQTRIDKYLNSPVFDNIPSYSLSEYWKFHSENIKFSTKGGVLTTTGFSGVYIPRKNSSVFQKFFKLVKNPLVFSKKITTRWKQKFVKSYQLSAMDISKAFDAVISHHPESNIELSPMRLNFSKISKTLGCFPSSEAIIKDYTSYSGGLKPNASIFLSYYHYNIFNHLNIFSNNFSFLEIGAGNGNLSYLLLRKTKATSYIIDLPKTICGAVEYLAKMIPNLKMILPHEAEHIPHKTAQLVFLTPSQAHLIPDHSLSLAVNCFSFQEMLPQQVSIYFDLIDRVVCSNGFFSCNNRVEKLTCISDIPQDHSNVENKEGHFNLEKDVESAAPISRFSDYPWKPKWETLIYEICPFTRLLMRDNHYLRILKLNISTNYNK